MSDKEVTSKKDKAAAVAEAAAAAESTKPFQERFAAIDGGAERAERLAHRLAQPGWPLPPSVKFPPEIHEAVVAGDLDEFARLTTEALREALPAQPARDTMIMALYTFWSPKPPTS